jgi:FkbM family methyltransferase
MNRLLRIAIAPLIWWIRLWQTPHESVPVIEKFARAAMMVPAFAVLLMMLRIRLLVWGPLTIDATTFDGGRFRCHPPDLIQMYLWLFCIWEPDVTHFIRRRLQSCDVFVDVGANIGYYSVLAARAPSPSGVHVVAIEASPTVANDLQESIALNDLGGAVRIINKAVAARVGRITVFAGPGHNTGLTTTVAERGMPAQSTIDAAPLDDLLTTDELHRARLVKIDVEGAEPQVLAGMSRVIAEGRAGEQGVEVVVECPRSGGAIHRCAPTMCFNRSATRGFICI